MLNGFLGAALLLAAVGCSDPPTSVVGITLTASASTATVGRGASTTVQLTVARVGGYDATVRFETENLPAGVTATFSPNMLGVGNPASTLTLAASSTATLGTATIIVRAIGLSVNPKTVDLSLTVTAGGGAQP